MSTSNRIPSLPIGHPPAPSEPPSALKSDAQREEEAPSGSKFIYPTSGSVLSPWKPIVVGQPAGATGVAVGDQRWGRERLTSSPAGAMLLSPTQMALFSPLYGMHNLGVHPAAVRPPAAQSGSPMKQVHSGIENVDDLDMVEDVQISNTPQREEAPKQKTEICCKNCGSHDVTVKEAGAEGSVERPLLASQPGMIPSSVCKLLVVGNAKCGKTSVIRRFVSDTFSGAYVTTIGADYVKKDVTLKDGRYVRLQLWDIAGQDRFVKLTRAYFAKARGVLVVCDLTRENTFEAVAKWKAEIDEWASIERNLNIPVVLIANKCDLLTDASASFLAGANMVHMCHSQRFSSWYVTSALDGSNVINAFADLVERAMAQPTAQDGGQKAGTASEGNRRRQSDTFRLSSEFEPKRVSNGWSAC